MSLVLKLYSSTLDSTSSPLPVHLSHRNFFETTIKDLLIEVHHLLAVKYNAPYNQIKKRDIQLSVFFPKTQKYMNINGLKPTTLLVEIGLVPGSIIHV